MKRFYKKLIAVVLVVVTIFTFTTTAFAATPSRKKGSVKYLSDVAIIEAESEEEADRVFNEMQKQTNNKFEGRIPLDLNKGGETKIYLAYAISTNVDDAITDLAVMNMEGNFTMGNYEQLLSETMEGYMEVTRDYRVMAAEFAKNYAAGNEYAKLAYRQMNYYYLEEDGQKTYMGDYLLNFPAENDSFANFLFRGNLRIIANLRSLLAMGMGIEGTTLNGRITDAYAKAAVDPSVYTIASYEKTAETMLKNINDMKENINTIPNEMDALSEEEAFDADDKEIFMQALEDKLNVAKAFLELLKEIPMGDTTLGDYVMTTPVLEAKVFFPIVAAGSEAEVLAMEYGSLYSLLLYDIIEKDAADIEQSLEQIEAEIEPMSVFLGVQNDLVSGTIGVTGNAEIAGNATGESVLSAYGEQATNEFSNEDKWYTAAYSLGVATGVGLTGFGIGYLIAKESAAQSAAQAVKVPLQEALQSALKKNLSANRMLADYQLAMSTNLIKPAKDEYLLILQEWVETTEEEVFKSSGALLDANIPSSHMTLGQGVFGSLMIATGVIVMGLSIWQLVELHNKYEIEYTAIPNNMVDVVATDTGDRFINYNNVPSYYLEDGKVATRENDLNAYDGLQWVSLYYTKNYEAGYCLTVTPDLAAKEDAKKGYTPIHLFGRKTSYNTNAYCNREGAEPVYLAFKYSANKKSAETAVPDVIGSIFSNGFVILSGALGIGIGAGATMLINHKRKPKAPKASTESNCQ